MQDITHSFWLAMIQIITFYPVLMEIVLLSLRVSLTATFLSCVFGLFIGASVAVSKFPGRNAVIILMNALMGLPPVVVGLFVYLNLSRAGPLGWLGFLYTPTAMIIAQTILISPIVAALSRQVLEEIHNEYQEQFQSLALTNFARTKAILWDG